LDFGGFKDRDKHARAMRREVLRRIGVPVRIGIAPTKTLAKCANDIAKKNPIFGGVLDVMDDALATWLLPMVPVGDIWGIGRKTDAKLQKLGIYTAADLRDMPTKQARAVGSVVLERTVLELQGEACIAFDDIEPQRKGMAVTRSAGTPMKDFDTVFQAVTAHATRAAEKLRQHGLVAGTLTVFFHTNRHRLDRPQYSGSRSTRITPMSSDTFDLVEAARRCAQAAWPKGEWQAFGFTKAGIMLADLIRFEDRPLTLFDVEKPKSAALMSALDQVNNRFGKKTLVLASEGMKRPWQLRSDHRSPRYTTRLTDLPVVR
jgi:DNA polymerase V